MAADGYKTKIGGDAELLKKIFVCLFIQFLSVYQGFAIKKQDHYISLHKLFATFLSLWCSKCKICASAPKKRFWGNTDVAGQQQDVM